MFLRVQKTGGRQYLLLVENQWVEGKVRQRVLHRLGRLDHLQARGELDRLMLSMQRFSEKLAVLGAVSRSAPLKTSAKKIGPVLVFERLWRQAGLPELLGELLKQRKFEFAVERAVFVTVLHRLMAPMIGGSDRAAEKWRNDYLIPGVNGLALHQLYRAMAWLGQPLPGEQQRDATHPGGRCVKDVIEERLFARRRDLFTDLSLVFFDTTSIYFEGEGGDSLGQYGFSKDHRPDRKQIIVGVVLAQDGTPICSELWPGNVADVTSLLPVIKRLRGRFGIENVCIVADRGMISDQTIETIEAKYPDLKYILGARMRSDHEVRDVALGWPGRYQQVHGPRQKSKDPSPLKVKNVRFTDEQGQDRRYIICHNEEQAAKDRADREAILAALEDQLKRGDKALVGNKGYRKYLKTAGRQFQIDRQKVQDEARFDGKWVLRTNWDQASAVEVALRYKDLWMVESIFRSMKSLLETRPIYHRCDETIRGHVFCSFLALVLRKALQDRLTEHGLVAEWAALLHDLDGLVQMTLTVGTKSYHLRSETEGLVGKVFAACRLVLPPTIRKADA